jgi:prophage regulatory protein
MPSDNTLLTIEEVAVRTRLSKPTIYKLIRQGEFPKQLRLCANKVAWLEHEVAAWIATRAEARPAG